MGDWQKFINEVKDKNDIVDIIGNYLRLTIRGKSITAVCPFHPDRNPSLHINRAGQYYKCFACGASGDVIKFVREYESLPFINAIELLANRAGLNLPERMEGDEGKVAKEKRDRKAFLEITRESAVFYHECLKSPSGETARKYLIGRGVTPKLMSAFGLGVSPDYARLAERLREKGFDMKDCCSAGVLGYNDKSGEYFDSLGNRLIIPIINAQNEVLGFGGRTLLNDKRIAKYKNTSDTALFDKSGILYNINCIKRLKQDGALSNGVVIVEGYMDVIGLAAHGITPLAASMGTSLTMRQARLIKRYTDEVYICFDGDSAGQSGALRGMDILCDEGLKVKVMTMPEGLDPDEFAAKFGKEGFLSCIEGAMPLTNYKLHLLTKKYDLNHANPLVRQENRTSFTEEALKIIGKLESTIEREAYIQNLAVQTSFAPSVLTEAISNAASDVKVAEPIHLQQDAMRLTREQRALAFVAAAMLNDKPYVVWERPYAEAFIELEPLFQYVFDSRESGEKIIFARAYDLLSGNVRLLELLEEKIDLSTEVKYYNDCMITLEIAASKRRIGELLRSASFEANTEIAELTRKIEELKDLYKD